MKITLDNSQSMEALGVLGGKEEYQGARREYLEFRFPEESGTVEDLDAAFSPDACAAITLETDSGEAFLHEGYIIRGAARLFRDVDDVWKIAVRRYQQTDLERRLADLEQAVASLTGGAGEAGE